jgi:hypothetical protein
VQDLDNMQASYIFYVKVGTFAHLAQSKTGLLTVNTMGIVTLTVQHDFIFIITFMYYPEDNLRETSADVLSLELSHIDSYQSCDVGCCTPQFIPVNQQTTSHRLIARPVAVGSPCNL